MRRRSPLPPMSLSLSLCWALSFSDTGRGPGSCFAFSPSPPSLPFGLIQPTRTAAKTTVNSGADSKSKRIHAASSSSTALHLADEIKDYRRGLSQIHSNTTQAHGVPSSDGPTSCVFKFGGSSLADAERIDHVSKLVKDQIETHGYRPRAVVCSAMGKTTNNLLGAGEFALGEYSV